jgi:hypothetical protein
MLGLEGDYRRQREAAGDAMGDAVRRAELVSQRMGEPKCRILLELERPERHPGGQLKLLPSSEVGWVRLGDWQILEQVGECGVAQVLDWGWNQRAIEVLCSR